MGRAKADIRIGISGWTYTPWRGSFYPKGLAQRLELEYAATQVNSIEINGSFYSLQKPDSYRKWYAATPEGFVFSVKGGRFITHMRRLKEVRVPLANFFASGVLELREKLGPILWQFPPNFKFDPERFQSFFDLLPRETKTAAKLAESHDSKPKGGVSTSTDHNRPLRYAVEIRHDSFKTPEFIALLRKNDVALVVADAAARWPYLEDITSDFVYARLHGGKEIYVSGYTDQDLDQWAKRLRRWCDGGELPDVPRASEIKPRQRAHRDVFVYFDNDVKVHAPYNALQLAERLDVKWAHEHDGQILLKKRTVR